MTELPTIPRPSQLWKQLPADRKLQAADAFWRDEHAGAEQAEVVATIAQRIKFRTKSVVGMPVAKKATHLVSLLTVSEIVAARLLVAYHLHYQRPMMGSFLEALGIAHEDGMIADEKMEPPTPERLKTAAGTLAPLYPAADVSLYLSTLVWQDPDTWGGLTEVLADPA